MTTFPSLFISHGSPMMALEDSPARRFLCGLGERLGRPDAILVASAHWQSRRLAFTTAPRLETIHDFGGFPEPLYRCRYEPPGAADAVARAARLLEGAGLDVATDPRRGLDHGAWVPLALMYPEADIPVAQITLQTPLGAAHQLAVGRALAPLRDEGVLIVGSGNITHGLAEMDRRDAAGGAPDWVEAFTEWVADALAAGDGDRLLAWREEGPSARRNHPTDDHFLPLFTAWGAGGGTVERLHRSYSYRALSMDMYAFA